MAPAKKSRSTGKTPSKKAKVTIKGIKPGFKKIKIHGTKTLKGMKKVVAATIAIEGPTKSKLVKRPASFKPFTPDVNIILPVGFNAPSVGALLTYALGKLQVAKTSSVNLNVAAAHLGAEVNGGINLPVILKLATRKPDRNEGWKHYKERIQEHLAPIKQRIQQVMGQSADSLITANALRFSGTEEQIKILTQEKLIEKIELDPKLQVTTMDDALKDIDLPTFRTNHPNGGDGSGVKVAVLDSGIDLEHPFLQVIDSISTCGESDKIPGSHGTHCAGSIASRDTLFCGVAPGVSLINVKVLQSNGSGSHTDIVSGVDAALDRGADVLSLSLGFNHLPSWSQGGHGWSCTNGHCPLCTAIDNIVSFDNVIAVVAAGNEHQRAEFLRQHGYDNAFDTELGCPGNAREAITVGAITKTTFIPAAFTSHGTTSYGLNKPFLVAPGVNISSTIPVPRDSSGNPISNPQRSDLFGRKSGTSMATPIVAGAVALIIQQLRSQGTPITSLNVRNILLTTGVIAMPGHGINIVGAGRLTLRNL